MLDISTRMVPTDSLQADRERHGRAIGPNASGSYQLLAAGTVALSAAACGGQAGGKLKPAKPDSSRPIATGAASREVKALGLDLTMIAGARLTAWS